MKFFGRFSGTALDRVLPLEISPEHGGVESCLGDGAIRVSLRPGGMPQKALASRSR